MPVVKPAAALACWGLKYQDGDKECDQCRFNDTCRLAMLDRCTSDTRTSLPVIRTYQPPPVPSPPAVFQTRPQQQPMVPLPAKPYYPPPPNTIPLPKTAPVQAPQQYSYTPSAQAPAQQPYYQNSTGFSLPSFANPNPMSSMHRPGTSGPAYHFTQYPGESVAKRVGKNLLLRILEALFGELWQFFKHFTWPPVGV